jgi:NAD(P)-dependent dehydrogenase (short-subunit alcohol dehydrogenase family)
MDPKGKVAVITGGASGIGLATARLLAANGARIVIADVQEEAGEAAVREIESQGGEARFVRTDVTKREDLQAMIEFAVREFGRVDIFYNNAGVSEGGMDFYSAQSDGWLRTVDINLTAVLRGTQLEVDFLRKQGGGGAIISTASMAALVPVPATPVYAATKAGVVHMSRSLGFLAAEGIRVNAICPTFTHTPLFDRGGDPAFAMAEREAGGILEPEQVAEGVLELVRDDSKAGAVMRVTVRRGLDYAR